MTVKSSGNCILLFVCSALLQSGAVSWVYSM